MYVYANLGNSTEHSCCSLSEQLFGFLNHKIAAVML